MLVKHQSQLTVSCYTNVNMRSELLEVTWSLRWKLLILSKNWQTSKYISGSQSVHYKDVLVNNVFYGFPFPWCFFLCFIQTLPSCHIHRACHCCGDSCCLMWQMDCSCFAVSAFSPAVMSTPYSQAHGIGSPQQNVSMNITDPMMGTGYMQYSHRHNGLYLYVGRIVRPLWNLRVVTKATQDKVQFVSM
jgi:hypothetical protein